MCPSALLANHSILHYSLIVCAYVFCMEIMLDCLKLHTIYNA